MPSVMPSGLLPSDLLPTPEFVPGTVLLVWFLIGAGAIFSARDTLRWRDLPYGFSGRVVGAAIALLLRSL